MSSDDSDSLLPGPSHSSSKKKKVKQAELNSEDEFRDALLEDAQDKSTKKKKKKRDRKRSRSRSKEGRRSRSRERKHCSSKRTDPDQVRRKRRREAEQKPDRPIIHKIQQRRSPFFNRRESSGHGDEGYQRDRKVSRYDGDPSKGHRPPKNVPLHMNYKVIRHMEEIQKRKMLWQSGGEEKKTTTDWGSMLAACNADQKETDKFKKLMGIKDEKDSTDAKMTTDERQKQQRLFQDLDKQYEVARMSTHTHRGLGLGFQSQWNELAAKAATFNSSHSQQPR